METLEQLKEVVKNAPDGATIIDIEEDGYVDYLYLDYSASSGEMIKSCCTNRDAAIEYSQGNIRSLSDIKLIIELMEDKKKAWKAYVELEEIKQKYNGENKIAKELLKLVYECDEFALPSDLRKDIKIFIGDL